MQTDFGEAKKFDPEELEIDSMPVIDEIDDRNSLFGDDHAN
jgi:hypothetical protein